MRVSDGINVQLTVSTGVVMADVPYVINKDYEEATAALEKSGFTVSKVKSMLFRIRKRLYAQLTEEGLV